MYPVKIYWREAPTIQTWDEKCIDLIEAFGLPGGRYITTFCEDYLLVNFYLERDAIHAQLLL